MDSDSTRFINAVKFANALKKFDFSRPSKQPLGAGGWSQDECVFCLKDGGFSWEFMDFNGTHTQIPSGYVNSLLLNMAIEIVDLPMKNGDFRYVNVYQRVTN
jgi:hypothetical protein